MTSLLTIAGKLKQFKCSSTSEGIMKMLYIYNMKYYLSVKKYETLHFQEIERNLRGKSNIERKAFHFLSQSSFLTSKLQ